MGPFPFPLQKSNNQQGLIAKTMGQRELATTGFAKSPFNNEEEETEGEEEEKEHFTQDKSALSLCGVLPPSLKKVFLFGGITQL